MTRKEYKKYLKMEGFWESEADLLILSKDEYLKEYPKTKNYESEFQEMIRLIE